MALIRVDIFRDLRCSGAARETISPFLRIRSDLITSSPSCTAKDSSDLECRSSGSSALCYSCTSICSQTELQSWLSQASRVVSLSIRCFPFCSRSIYRTAGIISLQDSSWRRLRSSGNGNRHVHCLNAAHWSWPRKERLAYV